MFRHRRSLTGPRFSSRLPLRPKPRSVFEAGAVIWVACCLFSAISVPARAFGEEGGSAPPRGQSDDAAAAQPLLVDEEARGLVMRLGAPTFAEREKALAEILRIGPPISPMLRKAIEESRDPELVQRADFALSKMSIDDLQARLAAFMDGSPESGQQAVLWFPGWDRFRELLGDSIPIRELFIAVMRAHPKVIASLTAATADRVAAAEQAVVTVQTNTIQRRQPPSLADGVALLLPLSDAAVAAGGAYERALLSVFVRVHAEARRDGQVYKPVSQLLENWMARSRIENRPEVLFHAMQWDLPGTGKLAFQTLVDTNEIQATQLAIQAIARFGTPQDTPKLAKLLEDQRPLAGELIEEPGADRIKITVADAAMAAAAIINQVSLDQIGMSDAARHPKVGFDADRIGYRLGKESVREEALARVAKWCQGELPTREAIEPKRPESP